MVDRASTFESIAEKLAAEAKRVADRSAELRVVAGAGCIGAFALWLAIAWGEPLALAALPLLATAGAGVVMYLRRRDRVAPDDEVVVPDIDAALLIRRTRPPTPGALAAVREPKPLQQTVTSAPPAATPERAPGTLQQSVAKSYEVHEAVPGGTVVHRTCPTLLAAADCALELTQSRPQGSVEVVKVSGGERKTVLSFSSDRPVSTAEEPQSLLDTFGYPVTNWHAAPPTGPHK